MMRVGRLPAATIRSTTPEFAELSPYRLSAPYSVVGLQKGSVVRAPWMGVTDCGGKAAGSANLGLPGPP